MFTYEFASCEMMPVSTMASKLAQAYSMDLLDSFEEELYDYRDELLNHGKIIMALWDKDDQVAYLTELDKVDKLLLATKEAMEDNWF